MDSSSSVSNVEIFVHYAGTDIRKWKELVSRKVVHICLGTGTVEKVSDCVYVNFNGEIKRWILRGFASYFSDVELPEIDEFVKERIIEKIHQIKLIEIEKELRRKAEEEEKQAKIRAREAERERLRQEKLESLRKQKEAMKEFKALKEKYAAAEYISSSPFDRLHDVLLKLEAEKNITAYDLKWLEEERLFGVIANFYEIRFSQSNDPWFLVKASRYWRDKGEPEIALELSLRVTSTSDRKLMSAILTTRGGAYRDLGMLSDAELCGLRAIKVDDRSYYPYSLMGAIYYQWGEPARGDEFFSKAREKGAGENSQDQQIRSAVKKADEDSKRRIIAYLLNKDPERYQWVKHFAS